MGHVTLHTLWGYSIMLRLVLAIVNLYIKSEIHNSTRSKEQTGPRIKNAPCEHHLAHLRVFLHT